MGCSVDGGDGEASRRLRCLIISDQLVRGVPRNGACHDVFKLTEKFGSTYLESEFKQSALSGFYDLVLISGHAAQSDVEVDIDGVMLNLRRDLTDVRTEVVYFNACDVGSNRVLLEESFSALGAKYVVAPVSMVPWGQYDNEATRIFARSLLSGSSVEDAVQACDKLWPGGNPYRVFSSADAKGRP